MSVPFAEVAEGGLLEMCQGGRSEVNESGIFEVAASRPY
jgi:hypothetical protein